VRVHVISDIEGVAGVVKWGQTGGDLPLYQEARRLSCQVPRPGLPVSRVPSTGSPRGG
jgi:D-aminopeptidase